MRASDLLGLPVRAPGGQLLGTVVDVRLLQEGRLRGSSDALRVEGFVIGRHRVASRLGYDRYERPGPAVVRWAVGWLRRHNRYLAWEDADLADGRVTARVSELGPVPRF